MVEKCSFNTFLMNFLRGGREEDETREDKRMVKLEFIFIFFKTALFEHILKNKVHSLFGARSILWIQIWCTP